MAVFDEAVEVGQAAGVGHVGEDAHVPACARPFRDEGAGFVARAEQEKGGAQLLSVPLLRSVGVEQNEAVALGVVALQRIAHAITEDADRLTRCLRKQR